MREGGRGVRPAQTPCDTPGGAGGLRRRCWDVGPARSVRSGRCLDFAGWQDTRVCRTRWGYVLTYDPTGRQRLRVRADVVGLYPSRNLPPERSGRALITNLIRV